MEPKNFSEGGQPDLQLDYLNEPHYATKGQRFVNFLIDYTVMYCFTFLAGGVYGVLNRTAIQEAVAQGKPAVSTGVSYLIALVTAIAYFTLIEGLTKGRSLGKLVTRTYVVDESTNQPINLSKALLRSIIRIVPFEVFSGFSLRPWHDQWSKTVVVTKKD